MTILVLDASVTLAALLPDEPHAEVAVNLVQIGLDEGALVPAIWLAETLNGLVIAERRGRITAARTEALWAYVRNDLHRTFTRVGLQAWDTLLALARTHRLSLYDASYLHAAWWHQLPLASLDRRLWAAAAAERVALMPETL